MGQPRRKLTVAGALAAVVGAVWYGFGVYLAFGYVQYHSGELGRFWFWYQSVAGLKAYLGLLLLILVFILVHLALAATSRAIRSMEETGEEKRKAAEGEQPLAPRRRGFPTSATVPIAIWLVIFSVGSIIGLLMTFSPESWPKWLTFFQMSSDQTGLLGRIPITIFAAGVGSSVTTILGFLKHASERKDFEPAYVPWYVARPLMGVLLGIIVYLLVVGGLVAASFDPNPADKVQANMAFAGLGALVGLFSKNAIEKLREVFNTLFNTKEEEDEPSPDITDRRDLAADEHPGTEATP